MAGSLLPLFPLEVVLLPEELLPLHIFEERYKQMIGECLSAKSAGVAQQEFGVVFLKEQETESVGCSARIVNVTRKYSDGRMDILTVGVRRFEIALVNEDRTYLRGEVEYFDDDVGTDTAGDPEAEQAIGLFREAMQRLHQSKEMPIHLPRPYRYLSFRLAAPLPFEPEFKQQLLLIRNEPERLRQVTGAIEELLVQFDLLQRAKEKAGGNGNVRRESS
jgi:ATP-dependent Lon protease